MSFIFHKKKSIKVPSFIEGFLCSLSNSSPDYSYTCLINISLEVIKGSFFKETVFFWRKNAGTRINFIILGNNVSIGYNSRDMEVDECYGLKSIQIK